jgi:hypothetical protein
MNTQHYMKLKEVVNPLTGTVISKDTPVEQLSSEKSILNVKRRELTAVEEAIDELLADAIMEAFEKGETTFQNFWKIQKGNLRFDEKLFLQKASKKDVEKYLQATELVKELTDNREYMKAGKPSIRYPRL